MKTRKTGSRRSLLLGVAAAVSLAVAAASGPRLSFVDDRNEVSIGTMPRDTTATGEMRIVNTGDSALVINTVFSGCRCARAKYPREAIAPGDTAVIRVTFDSHRYYPGAFVRSLSIRSNDKNSPHDFIVSGVIYR